jgi:hypothetical protein
MIQLPRSHDQPPRLDGIRPRPHQDGRCADRGSRPGPEVARHVARRVRPTAAGLGRAADARSARHQREAAARPRRRDRPGVGSGNIPRGAACRGGSAHEAGPGGGGADRGRPLQTGDRRSGWWCRSELLTVTWNASWRRWASRREARSGVDVARGCAQALTSRMARPSERIRPRYWAIRSSSRRT